MVTSPSPTFTFGQVEAVLAAAFRVAETKRPRFMSRLQQLQKFRIPGHTNVGRGRNASYTAAQIFKLNVALDLLDAGITPKLIADIFSRAYDDLAVRVLCEVEERPTREKRRTILFVIPQVLTYLASRDGAEDPTTALSAIYVDEEGADVFAGRDLRARIIIDFSDRVRRLIEIIKALHPEHANARFFGNGV